MGNPGRQSLIAFLRKVPLFEGLDDYALAQLAQAGRMRHVARGRLLFGQAEPADAFYVVRSGRITLMLDSPDGRELVIDEMRAGDVFGELGLITGQRRSTGATARDASDLFVVPGDAFLGLLGAQPDLMRRILEMTARRLKNSSERESALAFLNAPARLARTLLQLDQHTSEAGYIKIRQEELAHRAGLTRQTAAQVLGAWRRAGWLLTGRGRIVLLDRAALQRQAEEIGSLS